MIKTLQGLGYLVSTLSVLMLGAVAWQAARQDENLFILLIAGMAASILGMLLRWISFVQDQREKDKISTASPSLSRRSDPTVPSGRGADISVPSHS